MKIFKRILSLIAAATVIFSAGALSSCELLDYLGEEFNFFYSDPSEDKDDTGKKEENNDVPSEDKDDTGKKEENNDVIVTGELSIHFLELGNYNAGDCVLINCGDTEILIDAGSRKNSTDVTIPYISDYVSDGTIEYCIATHAHEDHIAGFVGSSKSESIFDAFKIDTLIDFPRTNSTSNLYADYCDKRDELVKNGTRHYTALECYNNENGAQRSYTIADDITMTILYNYYYEHDTSDENNYSVCILLTQGNNNYLFTGDLEEKGEEYLVQYNSLPECELFKAGHHGSKTSSNECLLSVIQPKIVCVCCCAGSDEYTETKDNQFPTQAFIDRVSKYTDKIYVTTQIVDNDTHEYKSMNGNIVVLSQGGELSVNCSNNNTVLKDTEWFKENRRWNA